MKRITAIVRPEKLEPLKEALFAAKVGGSDGFSVGAFIMLAQRTY